MASPLPWYLALLAFGCGPAAEAARAPRDAHTTEPPKPTATEAPTPPPSASASPETIGAACTGADVDFVVAMNTPACAVDKPRTAVAPDDVETQVTLAPESPRAGEAFTVTITHRNLTSRPLDLTFYASLQHDSGSGVIVGFVDANGQRIMPSGRESCPAASVPVRWAHVVLPPSGVAHASVKWRAAKLAWVRQFSDSTVRVAGCPAQFGASLGPGAHDLLVVSPLDLGGPVHRTLSLRLR